MFNLMHVHHALFCSMLLLGYLSGALAGFAVFHFGVFGEYRRVVRYHRSQRAKALRWPEPSIHSARTIAPPDGSSFYTKKTVNVTAP